jgi:hypothetical protein
LLKQNRRRLQRVAPRSSGVLKLPSAGFKKFKGLVGKDYLAHNCFSIGIDLIFRQSFFIAWE